MATFIPDRDFAFTILKEYVQNESLIRHAFTIEAVMKYFAELFGENEVEKGGIIGLLHDIDYERYPDKHCLIVREILSPYGFPEEYLRAIESHGYKLVTDVKPVEKLEKVLYAIDELTGLIAATVLLRPSIIYLYKVPLFYLIFARMIPSISSWRDCSVPRVLSSSINCRGVDC